MLHLTEMSPYIDKIYIIALQSRRAPCFPLLHYMILGVEFY